MELHKLACSSLSLHAGPWAYMKFHGPKLWYFLTDFHTTMYFFWFSLFSLPIWTFLTIPIQTPPAFALQDSVQAAQVLNQVLNEVSPNFVHCEPSYERSFELTKKISCLLSSHTMIVALIQCQEQLQFSSGKVNQIWRQILHNTIRPARGQLIKGY